MDQAANACLGGKEDRGREKSVSLGWERWSVDQMRKEGCKEKQYKKEGCGLRPFLLFRFCLLFPLCARERRFPQVFSTRPPFCSVATLYLFIFKERRIKKCKEAKGGNKGYSRIRPQTDVWEWIFPQQLLLPTTLAWVCSRSVPSFRLFTFKF